MEYGGGGGKVTGGPPHTKNHFLGRRRGRPRKKSNIGFVVLEKNKRPRPKWLLQKNTVVGLS